MKKLITAFAFSFISACSFAQTSPLPVQAYYAADTTKPLLLYISGDGGMNKFSTALMLSFLNAGYASLSIDARSYFWTKKTPQQAASDINNLLHQYLNKWHRKQYILMGYSFGADVTPFIFNRLPADIQAKNKSIVFISPSSTTDLEIHVTDMLGFGKNKGQSVLAEINKVNKPVVFVFGKDEKEVPVGQVTLRNKQVIVLEGGHHFEGDTKDLGVQIINKIR